MDCYGLSTFATNAMMVITFLPAAVLGLLAFGKSQKYIETKWPGADNDKAREMYGFISFPLLLTLFGVTWIIGLSLAESLFCS